MKYLGLFLFILSCADISVNKPREIGDYYQNSGILNYYLSEVPLWASFSTSGGCFHKQSTTFVNLQKIQDNFGLNFSDSLQFQLQINLLRKFEHKTLQIEEQFFYDSLEKIRSKFYPFKVNDFGSVNLVWLEGFNEKEFKNITHSPKLNSAPVVFLSFCLNHLELRQKLESLSLPYQYQILPTESLTIYSEKSALPNWQIPLKAWLGEDKNIFFHSKRDVPPEIKDSVILQK
jgi:hypothetical protein